ncbi:hypothetical protein SAMN00808754_1466 [Thermanaeromonas toyohensis ToBE]|uniref:TrbC/VIRB2 family protein n=1 Tax=Thermanaeromonas toyohensis ToBE TaxID=698762 RepID=A0A1W1VTZ0_9FIRM|nr:hypothetical protein [Thermanaeromonas toyohensis]SMB96364.1 hypothetical protein SAMN00808754_1466 [Thermanaeromonas toyohensis ToBE]
MRVKWRLDIWKLIVIGTVDIQNFLPQPSQVDAAGEDAVGKVFALVNILSGLIGVLAFLSLIAAGYLYIASCGDEKKVEDAKKLTGAAIAAIILVVLAKMITEFLLYAW